MRRFANARSIRRIGFSMCCWAIALAAFVDVWQAPLLLGAFLLGIGIGLGDWEGGDA
ncbi:hypothetical protein [Enorma sp.]|uniref:hypothetical protein n=1 Tax=Enorma sp. TaxID=1920692 RepID=UPI0025C02885|nr:hypothetical protein [Enorma sp.]